MGRNATKEYLFITHLMAGRLKEYMRRHNIEGTIRLARTAKLAGQIPADYPVPDIDCDMSTFGTDKPISRICKDPYVCIPKDFDPEKLEKDFAKWNREIYEPELTRDGIESAKEQGYI